MNKNSSLYEILSDLTRKSWIKQYEFNQMDILKTDEEYKLLIEKWIESILNTLENDLIQVAKNGKNVFYVKSKGFKNPGILPNGTRCNLEWQFHAYLTELMNPEKIFQTKLGEKIKIQSDRNFITCGQGKYPSLPQDTYFLYKISW